MNDISGKFRKWLLEKDKWGLLQPRVEMCHDTLEIGFFYGYTIAQKELEDQLKEAREVIEFYAKKEVWGVDTPHMTTSIDPCDQEQLDAWGTRGGKRARTFLAKMEKKQ